MFCVEEQGQTIRRIHFTNQNNQLMSCNIENYYFYKVKEKMSKNTSYFLNFWHHSELLRKNCFSPWKSQKDSLPLKKFLCTLLHIYWCNSNDDITLRQYLTPESSQRFIFIWWIQITLESGEDKHPRFARDKSQPGVLLPNLCVLSMRLFGRK